MVPIYDSDVAEERWAKAGWNQYELWEKVELRLRRNKRIWIAATILVFLGISAIPIVIEQRPKWRTLSAVRRLSQELGHLKRDAGIQHSAFRIRFNDPAELRYSIDRLENCRSAQAKEVRTGVLIPEQDLSLLSLLTPAQGVEAGVPGLLASFCYDPLKGSEAVDSAGQFSGFGIIPKEDLQNHRYDRLSVLLLGGTLAEMSFE